MTEKIGWQDKMILRISKLENLAICIYCLFLTLPILSQIFPTIINMGIHIIIGLLLFRKVKKIQLHSLVLLFLGIFIIAVPIIVKQGINVVSLYQVYYNLLPLIVGLYIMKYLDKRTCSKILRLMIFTLFITTLTTCIALTSDSTISRFLATGSKEIIDASKWGNVGGFEFIYGMVPLLNCYVILYKKKIINFYKFIILYILSIYCIFLSQYTLALLLSISSLVLLAFAAYEFNIKKCFFTCLFTLVVIFQKNILIFIISTINKISNSEIVTMRLSYLLDSLNNVSAQSDVSIRFDAYKKSWCAFKDNFISINFPSNISEIGGHSTILDTLGSIGLLGLISVVMYYIIFWRHLYRYNVENNDKGYFIYLFILVISMQIFNPFSITNYIFCILMPLMVKNLYFKTNE